MTDTDGYQVTAALTWQSLAGVTLDRYHNGDGNYIQAITSGHPSAIGSCVETWDSWTMPLAPGATAWGNHAICHWLYYLGQSDTASTSLGGAAGTDFGETRYYTSAEWGTAGSRLNGGNIRSLGHAITSTEWGLTKDPDQVTTY